MYTQCPECSVAFRVTAEVLRQAAGKVRCGGCGIAFNALNHLSEHKPQERAETAPEPKLPELAPDEPDEFDDFDDFDEPELEADAPPQSISAEQSAALLKTLDQLAGSDIRIEDTGVEWRVLNDDEDEDDSDVEETPGIEVGTTHETGLIADTGSLKFIIEGEESDAPTDEGTGEPSEVVEEMRFDDNTPLPDDFDFYVEPPAASEPLIETAEPGPPPDAAQVDLALGDPEEWEDLLGDLDEPVATEAETAPEDVEEAIADEMIPEEPEEGLRSEPLDMDTQFAIQAEAMGIDLSGLHATADAEQVAAEQETDAELGDDLQVDSGDTSIEEDLIAAAFETEAARKALAELERDTAEESSDEVAEQAEPEEEFELDAAEGLGEEPELEEAAEFEAEAEPQEAALLDAEPEAKPEEAAELDTEAEPEDVPEEEVELQPETGPGEQAELDAEDDIQLEFDGELEAEDEVEREDDVDDIALAFDDKVEEAIETIAASFDQAEEDNAAEIEAPSEEHSIPEMTEEEKTINMMIDQELFNIAVEDEEGFASTIVQLQPGKKVAGELADNKKEDRAPLFETIVMEGETVRGEQDLTVDSRRFDDPGVSIPLKQTMSRVIRGGRRSYDPPARVAIVAVVALVLLLILQVMHQSREALATVPAFNQTIGPVYRMIGKPLTPTWNISGWRFEATKGSTDETDQQLTIYSRVGNNSDAPLPYPLVHLSLTDRFEEIIGSRVLEPGEYLAEDADPGRLVPPGNTFNAVISIASPSEAATGFKLNVCYRLSSGQLRCAIEDFK